MDFELTEEQKGMKALARQFCKREIPGGAAAYWREHAAKASVDERELIPWDLIEKLHDVGLRQLTVPEKYGGGSADVLTAFIVAEELTRSGGPIGYISTLFKLCADLAALGNEQQQDEFFTRFMENPRMVIASAITESDAAGDIMLPYDEPGVAMKTFAYRDGDEYVVNGEKQWCTAGAVADLIFVYARTDKNAPISKGASMFLVPAKTPGLSVERVNRLMIPLLWPSTVLHFENVRVPARYLVGEENNIWSYMRGRLGTKVLHHGRRIGHAQSVFEYVKEYAKTRIGGGKPIIEHGNVGALVAEMATIIETARLLCYKASWQLAKEQRETGVVGSPFLANCANFYVKHALVRVCQIAAEILAGVGGTIEQPLDALVRMTFGTYHGGGTPGFMLVKAAKQIDDFVPTGY